MTVLESIVFSLSIGNRSPCAAYAQLKSHEISRKIEPLAEFKTREKSVRILWEGLDAQRGATDTGSVNSVAIATLEERAFMARFFVYLIALPSLE